MATTTIPWGDGSGDNIYLTYPSASGDQTVDVSSDANTGAARSKVVTFTSGVGNITQSLTINQERAVPSESRVQYLDNINNVGAYIDTGVLSGTTIRIIVTVSEMGRGYVCGARKAVSSSALGFMRTSTDTLRFDLGNRQTTINSKYIAKETPKKYELNATTRQILVDDVVIATSRTYSFSNSYSMYLFGANQNNTHMSIDSGYHIKIWGCQIYDGSTLVRDFVPYRVQQTGYMKDLVSGNLYGNSGSGSFSFGSDIVI